MIFTIFNTLLLKTWSIGVYQAYCDVYINDDCVLSALGIAHSGEEFYL